MITILADEQTHNIGLKLYEAFRTKKIEADYISLEKVEVKPCYSCGGCTDKTYGKCIVRDDGDWIYPKLIKSDAMLYVTPIVFGNMSFKVKRVLDKCALIGDRHYKVVDKQMTKSGFLGKLDYIHVVGVKDSCSKEEKEAFEALHKENLIITTCQGKAYVVNSSITSEDINNMVEEMRI